VHRATVDPLARRVLTQRTLAGELLASGHLPDGLVLLLGPPEGIGPALLVVVDADGRIRTVPLPGIGAGFQEPADYNQIGASSWRAQPGLAVDPTSRRALVVAQREPQVLGGSRPTRPGSPAAAASTPAARHWPPARPPGRASTTAAAPSPCPSCGGWPSITPLAS
jgi:hypothetical protein